MVEKLIKIQSELKAPKNQKNTFGKYNYRSCEDILEAVKPLIAREGLLLTLTDTIEQIGNRFYVKATVKLTDGKQTIENTAYAREEETKKGMDGPQVTGTSSSYARKYALNGLFCIDDTKDADTDEYKTETAERSKVQDKLTMQEAQKHKVLQDFMHKAKDEGITADDVKLLINFKFKKHSSKELTLGECKSLEANYLKFWEEYIAAQAEKDSEEDKKLMEAG